MIEVKYKFSRDIMKKNVRELMKEKYKFFGPFLRFIGVIIAVSAIVGLVQSIANSAPVYANIFLILLGLIFFFTIEISKATLMRPFKKSPQKDSEVTIQFHNDKIVSSSNVSKMESQWVLLKKFKEVKDGFLLFSSSNSATYIPKKAFKNNQDIVKFIEISKKNNIKIS